MLIGNLVICGDFNMVIDREIDRTGGTTRLTPELKTLLLEEDLHDFWRYQHPGEKDFTFFSNPHQSHSRIDFFLLNRDALRNALSAAIGVSTWSDHAPIMLTMVEFPKQTGFSPWRINNFLLKSPKIISEISNRLTEFF